MNCVFQLQPLIIPASIVDIYTCTRCPILREGEGESDREREREEESERGRERRKERKEREQERKIAGKEKMEGQNDGRRMSTDTFFQGMFFH